MISEKTVKAFKKEYETTTGKTVSLGDARCILVDLVKYFDLLAKIKNRNG